MTTPDARTERLIANRRAASAKKQASTLVTIEEMTTRGDRVNFVEVQRAAGVSTWFVYNNPVVRHAIEVAMTEQKNRERTDSAKPVDDRTTAGLRVELFNARAEIRDLRDERDRLRQRLQRSLGEQFDTLSKRELLEQLRVAEGENAQLQSTLRIVTADLAASNRERDAAVADLEGTQLALRQTMREVTK